MTYHEYVIVGRQALERGKQHKLYRMRVFATNPVAARNRFWYFLARLRKVKRTSGEIVAFHEVFERRPQAVKTFGITARYNSKYDTHNLYKEYRAISRTDAVQRMYNDLASQQAASKFNVQIVSAVRLPVKAVTSKSVLQFLHHKVRFPLTRRVLPIHREHRRLFAYKRPTTVL